MRSRYALINGSLSILIFIINGAVLFVTRKVMLPILGSDLVGLTAAFSDILAFLNLADMGLSGSIGASLYEPIAASSYERIKGILLWFKKIYRYCGYVFTSGALIVAILLKLFFHNANISANLAAVYFILTAATVGLSYFFSYRLIILSVDQRMFRLKLINSLMMSISGIIKIAVLYNFHSFTFFLIIGIFFTLLYLWVINFLIKSAYSKVESSVEKLDEKDKNKISKNVKGLVFHQIGFFSIYGTNNIYTAVFAGLTEATVLSNYTMILNIMGGIICNSFTGFISSIGNLIASENTEKRFLVFRLIFLINCVVTITASIAFLNSVQPFVAVWFGENYVAEIPVVYLLVFNWFINTIRLPAEQFKNAGGIFYEDRYVPLFESVVNIIACIILGYRYGMKGVILGNIISTVFIVAWQKPYMAFKYIFKKKLSIYFGELTQYLGVGVVCLLVSEKICQLTKPCTLWSRFFLNAFISLTVCTGLFIFAFCRTERFHSLLNYALPLFNKKPKEKNSISIFNHGKNDSEIF